MKHTLANIFGTYKRNSEVLVHYLVPVQILGVKSVANTVYQMSKTDESPQSNINRNIIY